MDWFQYDNGLRHERVNHSRLMTKGLRRAIMTCSRVKNIHNKKRSYNWDKYKKQRNFSVKFLRRTKLDYFNNIDIKSFSDTKKLTYYSPYPLESSYPLESLENLKVFRCFQGV